MKIGTPATHVDAIDGSTTVFCNWEIAGRTERVFFKTRTPLPAVGADPFVCLAVVPAMKTGEDVTLDPPVSARLLNALPRIQITLGEWYPALLRPVKILATPHDAAPAGASRGVGCFFSGGVDSFYSVVRHFGEIDTLIFAHGFDIPLANTDLRRRVSLALQAAARDLGKTLIEVETNAREVLDPFGHWGKHTHGAALAAVAHLLSGVVRKVYIPSSYTRAELEPWGSHPALDPLWSSEAIEIVHDEDDDASRMKKTSDLAHSKPALAHLRVCWENRDNAYNCGQCEKCLRTMLMLRTAGALDRCPMFATPLDFSRVERLDLSNPSRRSYYEQILNAARTTGDPSIVHAVERAMRPKRKQNWVVRKAKGLVRKLIRR